MITLTRRQARGLRGVFRRSVLGIAHRGPIPPAGLHRRRRPTPRETSVRPPGRRARVASAWPSSGSVALPLEALADLEGRDEATVALESLAPDRTVARWTDRGIPQAREYPVAPVGPSADFPAPPPSWAEAPTGLLDALAEATATAAEDDSRYALSCLALRPGSGSIAATDGRQVLVQGGLRLPLVGRRPGPPHAPLRLPRPASGPAGLDRPVPRPTSPSRSDPGRSGWRS